MTNDVHSKKLGLSHRLVDMELEEEDLAAVERLLNEIAETKKRALQIVATVEYQKWYEPILVILDRRTEPANPFEREDWEATVRECRKRITESTDETRTEAIFYLTNAFLNEAAMNFALFREDGGWVEDAKAIASFLDPKDPSLSSPDGKQVNEKLTIARSQPGEVDYDHLCMIIKGVGQLIPVGFSNDHWHVYDRILPQLNANSGGFSYLYAEYAVYIPHDKICDQLYELFEPVERDKLSKQEADVLLLIGALQAKFRSDYRTKETDYLTEIFNKVWRVRDDSKLGKVRHYLERIYVEQSLRVIMRYSPTESRALQLAGSLQLAYNTGEPYGTVIKPQVQYWNGDQYQPFTVSGDNVVEVQQDARIHQEKEPEDELRDIYEEADLLIAKCRYNDISAQLPRLFALVKQLRDGNSPYTKQVLDYARSRFCSSEAVLNQENDPFIELIRYVALYAEQIDVRKDKNREELRSVIRLLEAEKAPYEFLVPLRKM